MLGMDVAEVGEDVESKTLDVEYHEALYPKVNSTAKICDSPGFQDLNDDDHGNKLKDKCRDPDVVLFCISMRDTRWTKDQVETVEKVTDALGKDIWKNSVLVLTFANEFSEDKIKGKIIMFSKALSKTLTKIHVDSEVVTNITTAIAGIASQPNLPGVEDWLTQLFLSCLQQVKPSGSEAILRIWINNDALWARLSEKSKRVLCQIIKYKGKG